MSRSFSMHIKYILDNERKEHSIRVHRQLNISGRIMVYQYCKGVKENDETVYHSW
jgi:hypothetical protein